MCSRNEATAGPEAMEVFFFLLRYVANAAVKGERMASEGTT
jgi:hypothetical protein